MDPSSPGGLSPQPRSPHSPSSPQPEASKRPLPKYTTIDLENELPELYSTSLNPNLHDPDLSMFYNQLGPPFYNYKRNSPPPSYPASTPRTSPLPSLSSKAKYVQRTERYKRILIAFFVVFVVLPFILLLLSSILPAMRIMHTRVIE